VQEPWLHRRGRAHSCLGSRACTAIFSLINAALLRTLPFPDSGRLAVVWSDNPGLKLGISPIPPANADIATWRERSQTFQKVSAFSPRSADLADAATPSAWARQV